MLGASSQSFELARSTGTCAATGRQLDPGERVVVALVEGKSEQNASPLERLDFSIESWDAGSRPDRALYGFWRSVVPDPNVKKKALIEDGDLVDLFEHLGDSDDPKRVAFRYLLALVLIRKRLLIYEDGSPADIKRGVPGSMRVRPKGVARPTELGGDGPPLIEVRDPGMDDQAVADATEMLGQIMNLDEEFQPGERS